jgi:hypothetical protein
MSTIGGLEQSDPWWRRLIFMTLVILALLGILGLTGFYLWFLFPVHKIRGLTYLETPHLILYYIILNLLDVIGIIVFAQVLYFRWVNTHNPVRDGIILGIYLVIFSWGVDIVVYVFLRNTLPSIHEYFLGKNQPEIGIAWLVAFTAAVLAGWLEKQKWTLPANLFWRKVLLCSSILSGVAAALTLIGIAFFDIRP